MSGPVMIMAGGTGGHIFPGLAVAERLRGMDVPVVWMGGETGLETRLVPTAQIELEQIKVRALRGSGAKRWLQAPLAIGRALSQAVGILRRHQPRSVLSMGGYAAGPGGLAARLLGLPLLVHEQNRVPGLTNRVLARMSDKLLTGFPDTFADRDAEWVGNPVRAAISDLPLPTQRMAGRDGPLRILVIGGSQGALTLNQRVPEALKLLAGTVDHDTLHQAGSRHLEVCRSEYEKADVTARVAPFIDDMADAYCWADLVICRAGALTVAEVCAAGLAAIFVPYPHAVDDHQTANAGFLVDEGAAILLPEARASAEALAEQIKAMSDRNKLCEMAMGARSLARQDAALLVARRCVDVETEA